MKLRAEITSFYSDEMTSRAIARALGPDNLRLPKGLRVETRAVGRKVVSGVECEGRIETLLATLDDLLACTQTAENMLRR